jgi:anaerobic magnesium-protoporphyrin IX monomethyl ester cyclase
VAKVLFIQDALYESFGPQYMSAVAKQGGHDVEMFILAADGDRNLAPTLRRMKPDVTAFSITSFGFKWAIDAAKEAKETVDTVTVFGGAHPTFAPDFIVQHPHIDLSCKGEGEGAFLDVCNAVDAGHDVTEIANMSSHNGNGELKRVELRPLVADLDTIPFADRTLHFKYRTLRELPYKRFMAGRGCPYKCTYCFNLAQKEMYDGLGKYVRYRSPENVIEEILQVKSKYGIGTVGFIDDTFTTNRKWLLRFLEIYREEIKLPFTCLVRANELKEHVAEALGKSGCRYVSFGVEVGNENIRNNILARHMTDEQIRNAAMLMHKYGVKFLTYNMFGAPGETLQDGLQTLRLNAEIGTDLVGASVFQPLIGTESFEYCQKEGYLDPEFKVEDFDSITVDSPLKKMPDLPYLVRLQKIAFIGIYWPKLIPFLGKIVKYPLDPLFALAYKMSMVMRFKLRFGLSMLDVVKLGVRSRGRFG